MAAVQAVAAGGLTFGIVAARQWRWRAFGVWAAIFLVCGVLFGMLGVLHEGLDRVRLLAMSLGGVALTTTIVAFSLRSVENFLRERR